MSRPHPDPAGRCSPPPPGKRLKPLRFVKGSWTSGGHAFDDRMRCSQCRRSWQNQQRRPSYCARAA